MQFLKKLIQLITRFSNELILIGALICFFNIYGFFNNKQSEIIVSDGFGYYSYLPAKFIYKDYSYSFLKENHKKHYRYTGLPDFTNQVNKKKVNKYFVGVAVLLLPFFLIAHWISVLFGYPPDGFSLIYQYFTALGGMFYLWVGCRYTARLMRLYMAPELLITFILGCLVFGTILYHYVVLEPSMSHVYSFAAIAAFLYYMKKLFLENNSKYLIAASIALGFVTIIRPVNGLVVLALPFLAGDPQTLLAGLLNIFKRFKMLLISLTVFGLIVFIQFLVWYDQAGVFIVWSYGDEGFDFSNPHLLGVLFSYKKGLFIYTPLAFLAVLGFFYLRKRSFELLSLLGFLFVTLYVMSSWHSWYYGMSFGFRPFIDYFAIVALLLYFAFEALRLLAVKIAFAALMLSSIYINQVQDYQYRNYILHWSTMTAEKYWKVFLSMDEKYRGYLWNILYYDDIEGKPLSKFSTDLERETSNWFPQKLISVGAFSHSGTKVCLTDSSNIYSTTLIIKSDSTLSRQENVYLRARFWKYSEEDVSKAAFIVSVDSANGKNYYYSAIAFERVCKTIPDTWQEVLFGAPLPRTNNFDDVIKIYVWNPTGKRMLLDDFEVEFLR